MKLIVELDDATDAGRVAMILDTLSVHRAYIRGAVLVPDDSDAGSAAGGGLGTEWW